MIGKIGLVFVCVVFAAIGAACNVSFSTAKITEATLAKDVSPDKEPIGAATTFDSEVPSIHCVVKLANAPDDTKLTAKWSIVNVKGQDANRKIVESDITAGGNKNVVDFTFTPNSPGLPPGEYKVDVYLNPQPGKDDPPAKTLNFTIKE